LETGRGTRSAVAELALGAVVTHLGAGTQVLAGKADAAEHDRTGFAAGCDELIAEDGVAAGEIDELARLAVPPADDRDSRPEVRLDAGLLPSGTTRIVRSTGTRRRRKSCSISEPSASMKSSYTDGTVWRVKLTPAPASRYRLSGTSHSPPNRRAVEILQVVHERSFGPEMLVQDVAFDARVFTAHGEVAEGEIEGLLRGRRLSAQSDGAAPSSTSTPSRCRIDSLRLVRVHGRCQRDRAKSGVFRGLSGFEHGRRGTRG
jgi:hypothetical protein